MFKLALFGWEIVIGNMAGYDCASLFYEWGPFQLWHRAADWDPGPNVDPIPEFTEIPKFPALVEVE